MEAREESLTPKEVAEIFRVDPKTVSRWASTGKLPCWRTPGRHRRFRMSDILILLKDEVPSDRDPS